MTRQKPNILIFFTAQHRWDCSGLHGNPHDLMPNFDRLAVRGTHLEHCFTCQPVCGPARACIQTGQYASTHGSWQNGIPLTRNVPRLAELFNKAGYHTGYIGKWHLARHKAGAVSEEDRGGYREWLASNALEMTSNAYDTVMWDGDNREVHLPGYRVDACTDAMIRFLGRNREDPFLLMTSFLEPHHQNHIDDYPPPDGYRERYARCWVPPDLAALGGSTQQHLAGYYGMVKRLDEALGRVVDALKSLRMLDRTIILFCSDHGCHFKTRNSEYKRSCHESSIRVPSMLHGGPFTGGGKVRELVNLVDLPPTLLDAAGIEVPPHMQGRSILPLVDRKAAPEWPGEVFFETSEAEIGRGIRTRNWKYHVVADPEQHDGRGGAAEYREAFLYDMNADPYELCNLAGVESHRELSDALQERLQQRVAAAGQPRLTIRAAEPRKLGQRVMKADPLDHPGRP